MIMSRSEEVQTKVLNALYWDLAVPPQRSTQPHPPGLYFPGWAGNFSAIAVVVNLISTALRGQSRAGRAHFEIEAN